jgi:hypothetical protein
MAQYTATAGMAKQGAVTRLLTVRVQNLNLISIIISCVGCTGKGLP